MTYNKENMTYKSSSPPPDNVLQEERDKVTSLVKYYEDSTTALVVQKNEKWLYINAAAVYLLGYNDFSELEGKSIWETIHASERQTVLKRIEASINGVNPGAFIQRWLRKDGSSVSVEVLAIPVENFLGQTSAIIKEVDHETKKIQEMYANYELITENMNEIISLLDANGRLLYVSPSYRDYARASIDEEIGRSSIRYIHMEDREHVRTEFYKLVKFRKPLMIKYRMQRKDGVFRYIESQGTCILNEEECSYVVVSRDVTEKHEAEMKLQLNEKKHRMILEHSNDLICMMNHEGITVYASPSYKEVLGYEQSEVIGKDILRFIHPEDYEKCQKAIRSLTETKQSITTVYRKRHASGHSVILEAKGMAVSEGDEQVNHFVFISRDITEKIQLEQYRENIEKLAIIGDVAAGFAHEIRNPLTSIKGFLKLLAKKEAEHDRMYHQIIEGELTKIEEVINGFISLAKPEAGEVAEVSLLKLIKNAINILTPQAASKNIRINISSQLKTIVISCKKNQMKQVFINILKNAVEAIEENGKIDVILEENQNNVSIEIHDNGVGIEEERLERIGVPFYTNKEKGIGLGMTVSNKIITEHKGSLRVESEPGEGTRVYIQLPRNAE
ncbi:PAS domain-containing sensor histidine kinase [Pseudalkalibacillus hwajinpoensis]|uniref:PAS domain-containing sensor histidine kinase n=1 Tax=Guptibacillus hwajinpoensis TaxID=208199 RepID=UPI001CD26A4D|nr:PAS domain-containing sensor histidine kinase [Pseudalkalibacillus hwajinpoensis]MCA0992334.1 PAS domain S-box protein [Pseudalkalibacillus hwajinpoensis]